MSDDDMPDDGSEVLFEPDEAGTASKLFRRHRFLAVTRQEDRRQMTLLMALSLRFLLIINTCTREGEAHQLGRGTKPCLLGKRRENSPQSSSQERVLSRQHRTAKWKFVQQ
jgi:hypothetical protein